jgi:hypothetical protein
LKVLRKLRESLSFSEEEIKLYKLEEIPLPTGGVKINWDFTAPEAEILIGEKATDIIVDVLKKLDKDGKLTDREYSVYEKFMKE